MDEDNNVIVKKLDNILNYSKASIDAIILSEKHLGEKIQEVREGSHSRHLLLNTEIQFLKNRLRDQNLVLVKLMKRTEHLARK